MTAIDAHRQGTSAREFPAFRRHEATTRSARHWLYGLARRFAAVALLAVTAGGCRGVIEAHGNDPRSAATNADGVTMALEYRFTNVERSPKFSHARMRIARYAFAPSKLINDTSVWTFAASTATGGKRGLEVFASSENGRYKFRTAAAVPLPQNTGDERHLMSLTEEGNNDWRWETAVDHAVGPIPLDNVTATVHAFFATLERTAPTIRNDYRTAVPRTAHILGQLLTVDSLHSTKQPDGSALVTVVVGISSDSLKPRFPSLAKYVDKYVAPARFHLRLSSDDGADWLTLSSESSEMRLTFRSRNGVLQPLNGAARRMPATMVIHIDARAKLGLFTVGASGLRGRFRQTNTPNARMWEMRFNEEPHWDLPLITERLLRSPLRRPFEGEGVGFRIGFRSGPSGQTLLSRDIDLTVRESAIMRFLGNLGFGAMDDFAGKVEKEENEFLSETFRALRADIRSY